MGRCLTMSPIQLLALTTLSSFLFTSIHAARPLRTLQQVSADEALTQCLESVVGQASVLIPRRDAGYENVTIVFSRQFHSFPVAIAFPKSTSNVQGIVVCSRAAGVQAVPRSGGHSYEGYSVINGTVLVDLSGLDSFTPSPNHSSARVGTGNRLGPLYYKAWTQAGRLFPAGLCPYVGAGGHILGGGVGLLTRKYGLASDQLTEVEMVTYDGSIIVANKASNPDLLFASQGGGGGSFGIVTTYTLDLVDPGNGGDVILFQVNWGADRYDVIPDFLRRIQAWAPNAPEELSVQVFLGDGGFHVLGVFVGTEAEFLPVFQQSGLTDLPGYSAGSFGPFFNNLYITTPYIEAALYFGSYTMGLAGTGNITDLLLGPDTRLTYAPGPYKAKSNIIYDPISDEGLEVIKNYINASNAPSYLEFNSLGGVMANIASDSTAYPHRGGIFDLQYQAAWDTGNAEQEASQVQWLDNFYAALQPYLGQPRAYVNYIDDQLPDYLDRYFEGNLARLERVKATFDPENYFRNPQSIPLPDSVAPTGAPGGAPTGEPTGAPTGLSTGLVTGATTRGPSGEPIGGSTGLSTGAQTGAPTRAPVVGEPNGVPTGLPTGLPSQGPTGAPIEEPTKLTTSETPSPLPSRECDPLSELPNQCFNADGSKSTCCPGACSSPPGGEPSCATTPPPSQACDPLSAQPNQCFNADGSASICCPGGCSSTPGADPSCP